jgi:putative phosphoribosyl transferase
MLAIPRGGVPVAAVAAHRLNLEWSVIVTRKLPIPFNPEAGFGAVAADGTVVLNSQMVDALALKTSEIESVVKLVSAEVKRRADVYLNERPMPPLKSRAVIIIDDGVASGYTMMAAIRAARTHEASRIVAAAPVCSRSAAALIEKEADECVFDVISSAMPFAVADFYVAWHDLTDEEIMPILRESIGGTEHD